jgi:hypothetical protein
MAGESAKGNRQLLALFDVLSMRHPAVALSQKPRSTAREPWMQPVAKGNGLSLQGFADGGSS